MTLYPKGVKDNEPSDPKTFLSYRASSLRRKAIREELGPNTADKIAGLELRNQQVLAMYDQKMRDTELRNMLEPLSNDSGLVTDQS